MLPLETETETMGRAFESGEQLLSVSALGWIGPIGPFLVLVKSRWCSSTVSIAQTKRYGFDFFALVHRN